MQRVRQLMGIFNAIELHHVSKTRNQEVDALAKKKLNKFMLGAISFLKPNFESSQQLQDVIFFLKSSE